MAEMQPTQCVSELYPKVTDLLAPLLINDNNSTVEFIYISTSRGFLKKADIGEVPE